MLRNKTLYITTSLIVVFLLSGCGIKYVEMPNLNLSRKSFPKPEEVSSLSFALAEPRIVIKSSLTEGTHTGLIERVKHDANEASCHLNNELDKILLSKGFTITNRFQGHQWMTFTEKRNTSALFYPEIVIDISEKSQRELTKVFVFEDDRVRGRIAVSTTVNIIMLEPLSGEKLWVKSLPIEELDERIDYKFRAEGYSGAELNGSYVPEDLVLIANKIDDLFKGIDESVITATDKFVERHEFEFLNEDIAKLKGIKRY